MEICMYMYICLLQVKKNIQRYRSVFCRMPDPDFSVSDVNLFVGKFHPSIHFSITAISLEITRKFCIFSFLILQLYMVFYVL